VAIWYIFHGYLVYTLWLSVKFYDHLVYFSPFWYVVPIKIWQPCSNSEEFAQGRRFAVEIHSNQFILCKGLCRPGTDAMILKIFSPKILAKIFAFFAQKL
jgi:hypothetical protein